MTPILAPRDTGCSHGIDEKLVQPLYFLGGRSRLDYPLHCLGLHQVIPNAKHSESLFATDLFLCWEKENYNEQSLSALSLYHHDDIYCMNEQHLVRRTTQDMEAVQCKELQARLEMTGAIWINQVLTVSARRNIYARL